MILRGNHDRPSATKANRSGMEDMLRWGGVMFVQIATIIAIVGACYVAFNKTLVANILWSLANPMLVFYNAMNGQIEQAIMFSVFSIISFYGVHNLTHYHGLIWYDLKEWNVFEGKQL